MTETVRNTIIFDSDNVDPNNLDLSAITMKLYISLIVFKIHNLYFRRCSHVKLKPEILQCIIKIAEH